MGSRWLQVRTEYANRVAEICVETFFEVTKEFNFRILLEGEAKVGDNWKKRISVRGDPLMKLITKHKVKGEEIPVTTSRKVAEYFGKEHKHVIESIEKLLEKDGSSFGLISMFVISKYKDKYKRDKKQYLLTQDGFTLLAMGFTGAKALEFKLAYIQSFNDMRSAIHEHKIAREVTRQGYKGTTQALKDQLGDDAKIYHFSNEADMRNKIVLGLTTKQYCVIHEIDKKKMRDHLETKDLKALASLEKYDEILIELGAPFEERKEKCEEYHLTMLRKQLAVEEIT